MRTVRLTSLRRRCRRLGRASRHAKESDRWCALVSDAILFAYGISVPEEHLWNAAVTGTLDKATVKDAFRWAQAVVRLENGSSG